MEDQTQEIKQKPKSDVCAIRVSGATKRALDAILAKINKKSYGRKVHIDQVLKLLASLVQPEHVQKLQEGSLSNADRLDMQFKDYCKKNGAIPKDQFLGMLLSGNAAIS